MVYTGLEAETDTCMMEFPPKRDPRPEREPKDELTLAWDDAREFLERTKPLILDRIITYVGVIPKNEPVPVFMLRAMAAAIEIGLVPPHTRDYLAETVSKTGSSDSDETFTGSGHPLSKFEISEDRRIIAGQTSLPTEGTTGNPSERMTDTELASFADMIIEEIDAENDYGGMHDIATLIRSRLLQRIDSKRRYALLQEASRHLPEFVRHGRSMLERELNVTTTPDRESNPSDWIAPHALYGLYELSDAKLVTDLIRTTGPDTETKP